MVFVGTHGALRADLLTGKLEVQQIGWETTPEIIDTKSRDGHGGGDAIMAKSLIRTMVRGEPPLASLTEGLCSAISAFGIDQACAEERVVDFRPLWEQAGLDPQKVMQGA